jgi:hypothetical protein
MTWAATERSPERGNERRLRTDSPSLAGFAHDFSAILRECFTGFGSSAGGIKDLLMALGLPLWSPGVAHHPAGVIWGPGSDTGALIEGGNVMLIRLTLVGASFRPRSSLGAGVPEAKS